MSAAPKISCLTVTDNRLVMLKEAIDCYCRQTYPNREMVIVTAGGERYCHAIQTHIGALGRGDIRVVAVSEPSVTLGQLRNISLEAAEGEVICQWDDDDFCHPERLAAQWKRMSESHAEACFLSDHLQFFVARRELLWIDWTLSDELPPGDELVPGTVMALHGADLRYPEAGRESKIGEDNAFRDEIRRTRKVAALRGQGQLYVYRFHGNNTTREAHHRRLAGFGCCDFAYLSQHQRILAESLAHYPLPKPYRILARAEKRSHVILATMCRAS
jgi:glycosyltransferase involved in cell wall biosynthesis